MGKYIDIGNDGFRKAREGEYVDKSMLIPFINSTLGTEQCMTCVTRARRFGKSMAAKMLCAYYDQSCDSRSLFADLKVADAPTFEKHLNQYPVIYLDITYFTTTCRSNIHIVDVMEQDLIADLQAVYPDVSISVEAPLVDGLLRVAEARRQKFIMIVDEWDAICREVEEYSDVMRLYVDWLRSLFKSGFTDRIFTGVYMTGILPIKQYNTQSALNNFEEFSMVNPGPLAGYFGFTQEEVHKLARSYQMDEAELKLWYDGYQLGNERTIYNPFAVMRAVQRHSIEKYWSSTSTYDALRQYILMDFDGLYESILSLVAGESVKVNVMNFTNDMHEITSRDAVITLLIHLGYLSYDFETESARIPNYEVRCEFENTIKETNWKYLAQIINNSAQLLKDTLMGNERAVELAIDQAHQDHASILRYNDENSLSCVLALAYVAAYKDFDMVREMPMGKGYADIVLIPKRNVNYPAVVIELKYQQSAKKAIDQIGEKQYANALRNYIGEVVLVGINYTKNKEHSCKIVRKKTPFSRSCDDAESLSQSLSQLLSHLLSQLLSQSINWDKLAQTMLMLQKPCKLKDIREILKVSGVSYFKKNYIDPLVAEGYVAMTIPDKPNSRLQMYYLTEKGLKIVRGKYSA